MKLKPTMTPEEEAEWERRAKAGMLWGEEEATMTGRARLALSRASRQGKIPYGLMAALADAMNVDYRLVQNAKTQLRLEVVDEEVFDALRED